MAEQPVVNVTEAGGIAVVILAKDFDIPSDYAYHPQVLPITASDLPSDTRGLSEKIPNTTKIVLIGGELPGNKFTILRTYLTRRSLNYVHRRNTQALEDAMRKCLPPRSVDTGAAEREARAFGVKIGEAVEAKAAESNGNGNGSNGHGDGKAAIAKSGSIKALVEAEADLNKSGAEEARRLMHVAVARGIPTTFGSIQQAIAVAKRKGGRTAVPKSIMSEQQKVLLTLDEAIASGQAMIAGLQLVREYVEGVESKNADLLETIAQAKKALGLA